MARRAGRLLGVVFDVGGESSQYVAGWREDGALDAIRAYAETIDAVARRIEHALDPGNDAQGADAAITAKAA